MCADGENRFCTADLNKNEPTDEVTLSGGEQIAISSKFTAKSFPVFTQLFSRNLVMST